MEIDGRIARPGTDYRPSLEDGKNLAVWVKLESNKLTCFSISAVQ